MKPSESRTVADEPTLPPLVLVGGAPATGKTTLAHLLAAELRLPLFTKDRIKELLGDSLGAVNRDASKRLGAASYAMLYASVRWILDSGTGVIVESNFWRGQSEPQLRPLVARARGVLIHCEIAPEEVMRRYLERGERGERHGVHFDAEEIPTLRMALESDRFEPLDLGIPTLRLNTTHGYNPDFTSILAFIRTATGSLSPGGRGLG